jgi:porin
LAGRGWIGSGAFLFAIVGWCTPPAAQQLSAGPDTVEPLPPVNARSNVSKIGRSPTDESHQLERDALARQASARDPFILEQWYGVKDRLKARHNFEFGLAYTAISQNASEDIIGGARGVALLSRLYDYLDLSPPGVTPTKNAAGGIFEFQGKWMVIGADTPNNGFIGFSVESRHTLGTEIPPQNLFLDAGAFWPTATAFNEFDLSVVSLYYEQYFADGAAGIRVGKMLPFTIYDYMSLKNPKTDFSNAAFNLNPAIGWASFGFGVAGVLRPIEPVYIVAGIHDINGGPNKGIQSFFEDEEYFKALEIGWDTALDVGNGNLHVLFWDTDARTSTKTPASRGFTVGGEQQFGRLLPFVRYGYSEGGGTPLRHLVAGGLGFKKIFNRPNDVIGVGLSWGEPIASEIFANQKALEVYYRVHLIDEIAVTSSVQYVKDPPLNLVQDELYLVSIRGRAAF